MKVKNIVLIILIAIVALILINVLILVYMKIDNKMVDNAEIPVEQGENTTYAENETISEEEEEAQEKKEEYDRIVSIQEMQLDETLEINSDNEYSSVTYQKNGWHDSILGLYYGDLQVTDLSDEEDSNHILQYMVIDNYEQYVEMYNFIVSQIGQESQKTLKSSINEAFFDENSFIIIDDCYKALECYKTEVTNIQNNNSKVQIDMKIVYTLGIENTSRGGLTFVKVKEKNIKDVKINDNREIEQADIQKYLDSGIEVLKPIIYLYPEDTTQLTVKLGYPEKLSCSYPKYENEWDVTAFENGNLVDNKTGKNLYSLYWEGKDTASFDMNEGFVIEGEKTAEFLEEKLLQLGLNEREAEEFIIYWLPKMQNNKYNFIRFATIEEIDDYMPLEFSKKTDTLIRILMQYKAIDEKISVPEQILQTPIRSGFVAVEWGGTEIK